MTWESGWHAPEQRGMADITKHQKQRAPKKRERKKKSTMNLLFYSHASPLTPYLSTTQVRPPHIRPSTAPLSHALTTSTTVPCMPYPL